MIRCYVIGASAELERAERVIAALRERGVEITHNWCADVRAARAAGHASDADLPLAEAREHAQRDLHGVERAEVVLLLSPAAPSFGAGVEWGYALRHHATTGRFVVAGGPRSIFAALGDVFFERDEDAVAWVAGLRTAVLDETEDHGRPA